MIKQLTHKGEKFMMYYELIEITDDMLGKKPLTPLRVCKIRDAVQKKWVELNIQYAKGKGYFSEEMFQYYLHSCFEAKYNANIN